MTQLSSYAQFLLCYVPIFLLLGLGRENGGAVAKNALIRSESPGESKLRTYFFRN
jgi:hypothetical protein